MANIRRFKSYFLVSIACLFVMVGCLFMPAAPSPKEQTEKIAESISEGGYSAEHTYTVKLISERWLHDGQIVEVLILTPEEPGNYPLILYLPSLGEHVDGGHLARELG